MIQLKTQKQPEVSKTDIDKLPAKKKPKKRERDK